MDSWDEIAWRVIEGVGDIDDALFLWEKLIKDCADRRAPIKSRSVKGMPTPWISNKLLEVRRDRDYHRKNASSNSQYHWRMYRKLRNLASREERSLKSQYYCKLIEVGKNDSSSIWKAIKQTLPSNHMDTNAVFSNGKLHTSCIGIAEHLNMHFSNTGRFLAKVFRNTSSVLSKSPTSAYDFKLNPVSESFVHKELSKMKANKAIGLDKIGARLLRDAACNHCQKSLGQPLQWRQFEDSLRMLVILEPPPPLNNVSKKAAMKGIICKRETTLKRGNGGIRNYFRV